MASISDLLRERTIRPVAEGDAPVAALLFAETPESIALRTAAAESRRLAPEPALSLTQGRPTKRDRRETDLARDWGNRWSASIDS